MAIEVQTEDCMQYKFFPVKTQALKFCVKASNDVHIALSTGPSLFNPAYEIFIGAYENSKILIRRNMEKPDVAELKLMNVLNSNEFRTFWITFYDKTIVIGNVDNPTPLLQWADPQLFDPTHFGIRTSWGATGSWQIEDNWNGWREQQNPGIGWNVCSNIDDGNGTWVGTTGGSIPPNALVGGFDNEQVYVGRAQHGGGILPGKVLPSHGFCYVPWGGGEHAVTDYEVLCNCRGTWIRTSGSNIPPTAIPGGKTEDGETLYIGRAEHEHSVAIGKVQQSHGVCYIAYGGQEIAKPEYDILVLPS